MLVAETALLVATRDRLRSVLALLPEHCDVELDDQVPAIAAKTYYAVIGAGLTPGPRHMTSGGVVDVYLSMRVVVYERITEVARDRRRNVFIDLLTGLNTKLDAIIDAIDFSYELTNNAALLLTETTAAGGEFPEPFRSFVPDSSPRMVYRDPYDAAQMKGGDPVIAMARGVTFSKCRFMKLRG